MPDFNPRKYSPADIDAMLAKSPRKLVEAALGGLHLMKQLRAEGTGPEPCIEPASLAISAHLEKESEPLFRPPRTLTDAEAGGVPAFRK